MQCYAGYAATLPPHQLLGHTELNLPQRTLTHRSLAKFRMHCNIDIHYMMLHLDKM